MSIKSIAALMPLSLLLLCGCATTQSLRVVTTPAGAQVTLIRYGVTEAHGSVAGASAGGVGASFEDPAIALGTSPLEYEFKLEKSGERVAVEGLSVQVARKYTEGLIRAEKDGLVAERRVRFSGKPVVVELRLPSP